jgi:hypothetical protein
VRSSLSDDRVVHPDTTYEGVIQVWNETDEIQEAKVYQTDYLFYSDGSNDFGDPGEDERSNADWTRVSASTIAIPPRDRILVSYLVEVPELVDGAPPEGSYWSMIMIEAVPEESPESTINPETGEPQYSVLQVMRYGVQVATHIAETGESNLALPDSRLVQLENGEFAFQVVIDNTGSRFLHPNLWVELYDSDGAALGRREGSKNRIYPGTSVKHQIPLGAMQMGEYRALVIIEAGDDEVFGAEYRLKVE